MIVFPVDSVVRAIDANGLPIYDRPFVSQNLADVYGEFFTNGVFLNDTSYLQVVEDTENNGMTVWVKPGTCHVNGRFGVEVEQRTISFEASDPLYDRIDSVVVRLNLNREMRNCELYVKKGEAAVEPARPSLTREGAVYELGLADVFIGFGQTNIKQMRITDTRFDSERCGMCLPFATIDAQALSDALDNAIAELMRQTDVAVDLAQGALDETIAGDMANQISEMYVKWAQYTAKTDADIESFKESVPQIVQTTMDGIFDVEY